MIAALARPRGGGTLWGILLSVTGRSLDRTRSRPEDEHDEQLVERAAAGDHRAFATLYRRHADRVWRILTRIVGPDPDREDLLQQVFVQVFRSLGRFRGEAAFTTYLHRVTTNAAFDHLQTRRRRPVNPAPLNDLDAPGPSPERRAADREQLSIIFRLLDRVKPKKRIAFVLRVVEGWSLEEIGVATDAAPDAVAQRVRHAHRELESMMVKRGIPR
jgi:RNA polymerase sigma-70 factor (ECF subfamily)